MAFILGVTGGIGSGKSAATQWFESQGIQVVDADIVAREVVEKGQPALQKIQQTFGDWVLQPDGNLDRRALREYIFQNPEARQTLEKITHPAIRQSIVQQLQNPKSPYVILVSPLLFETNQHELKRPAEDAGPDEGEQVHLDKPGRQRDELERNWRRALYQDYLGTKFS